MKFTDFFKGLCVVGAVTIAGCSYAVNINGHNYEPDMTPTPESSGLSRVPATDWYELSQGWNSDMRRAYWFTPQGSVLVPYTWFLNLEMPDRSCRSEPYVPLNPGNWTMFRDPGHLRSLGYIPAPADPLWNPDGLPIGFARRITDGGDFLGPTCAMCHSNLMALQSKSGKKVDVLIDGAPTLGDLQAFNEQLADALCSVNEDWTTNNTDARQASAAARFDRFAERVLKNDPGKTKEQLRQEVRIQTSIIAKRNAINYSEKRHEYPRYGKGRLDAIGAILNEVAVTYTGESKNITPANAPVSYPFLWGTPQADVTQWTGFIHNQAFGFGPLGRNVGEVVGVYGYVDAFPDKVEAKAKVKSVSKELASKIDNLSATADAYQGDSTPPPVIRGNRRVQFKGFKSSILMPNLGAIEHWLGRLKSPVWPEDVLPKIDEARRKRGELIYTGKSDTGAHCEACHALIPREKQLEAHQVTLVPVTKIKTDEAAISNFVATRHPLTGEPWRSGHFEGERQTPIIGERYGPYLGNRGDALATIVKGVIFGNFFFDGIKGGLRGRSVSKGTEAVYSEKPMYRYKARPLTGIWATAPYLHNGSVRNLMELLWPEKRAERFCTGDRTFDHVEIGFVSPEPTGPDKDLCPEGTTLVDTAKFGSRNTGHAGVMQGSGLSDKEQRLDLIEFLKTL